MPAFSEPSRDKKAGGRLPRERPLGATLAPPLDALWSYRRRDGTDLNIVKAARAATVWRSADGWAAARMALLYLRWPFRFPRHLVRAVRRESGEALRRSGRSRAGQVSDILRIAVANCVMPADYYSGSLARLGGGPRLFDYLPSNLLKPVIIGLSDDADATLVPSLLQKSLFEQRCRATGLRVVRTVAIADGNSIRTPEGGPFTGPFPERDLIVKPDTGGEGRRIELWRWQGRGHEVAATGAASGFDDLAARAMALAAEIGCPALIQERLTNHPALRPIAGDALATMRIVTALDERGEPEIVEAFYRTSVTPGAPVDNFHAGGVIFPVDIANGVFRPGMMNTAYDPAGILDHPATGTRVVGRAHPAWAEMSDFALRLHRAFPGLMMPGWDIGWDENGVVAVEGNPVSGLSVNRQGTFDGAVGTRAFHLLAHHAGRWLERNEPEGSRWRFRGTR